jgi:AbrB family looped-hinge helix DNA binding protein
MSSVLDEKRRVVLPKEVVEELGLAEGTAVAFEKGKGVVIMKKKGTKEDPLREAMSWNPKRTRRPRPVREREIKEIWG